MIEVIELVEVELIPARIYFPDKGLTLTFSDYHDKEGISYSGEVTVQHSVEKHRIELENRKRVFNTSLADELFQFKVPRAFRPFHFQAGSKDPYVRD